MRKKPLPTYHAWQWAVPGRSALLSIGLLLLLLCGSLRAHAQVYYTLNDGQATTTLDQLRRVNADGTGDVLIKDNFIQIAGPTVLDAANNRILVADLRPSQASTSFTNAKIVAVNLTTGNATTLTTVPAISGAASTTIGGLALDRVNNYVYYTLADGAATATLDQLRRVNFDGTGDILIKDNFVQTAGPVVLDAANNRVLVADVRVSQASTSLTNTKVVAVNLATTNVTTLIIAPAISGAASTVINDLTLDKVNNYVYYTLTDGAATATLDQLRRVNLNGTGDILIKDNFVQTAGAVVLDAPNNRVLVAEARSSQASTSLTNTKVVAVNLATTNVTTLIIAPAISGATSTTVNGITLLEQNAPTVTTAAATTIGSTSAVLGGNVTADGGASVTERGVVYSTTNQTPTTSDTKNTNGLGNGSFSENVTGLTASTTYYVRAYATNSVGTSYGNVISFTTAAPVSGTTVVTNVSCFSGSNGTINLTPTGGRGPYTYLWNDGATTEDRTGLSAGAYSVTITDATGATGTVNNIIVTQRSAISATTSQTNIACNGGATGAASVSPVGGTSPYTYRWSTGATTQGITGLSAGAYSVTITDANGCTRTYNFTITQPAVLSVSPAEQTNIACFGGATGAARINTPTGGTSPYSYNWTPGNPAGDGTTSVSGLSAGTYTVTVTDQNGCTAAQSFTITQPASALAVTPAAQTNIACFGGSSGSASINTPTGGTAPYNYNWTPGNPAGDGTRTVTGLSAGTYTVTVTDQNGCTAAQSFTITQPAALTATTSQTNVTTNGGNNGSATITVSGGTPGYIYSWSPNVSTSATASNLRAGTYSVTATDANGCNITRTFNITQPASVTVTSATRLDPSPTAMPTVRYQVTFSGSVTGVSPSNFTFTTTGSISNPSVVSVVGSGSTYTVTVTTGNGPFDGTLQLNVNNGAGISPPVTNTSFSGAIYTITKNFAAKPQLTIVGTGGAGSDVTAFVDLVQVLDNNSPFTNALQNGSFEEHAPLANGDFGYNPTGASWTFNSLSGIAESGSAFTPTTPIPNGIAVAFVQSTGGSNGQLQQTLALPTSLNYQVRFQTAQRVCCTTLDQRLNVLLNDVFIGTIQPGSDGYSTFTSAAFGVTAPAVTATISSTATNPTSTSPIPVTVTFSASVTGFTASDVAVSNGTISGFSGSGTTYTFNVTPASTGTVTVNVAANAAVDGNNTGNTAASQFSIQYNQPSTAAPVVTVPANGSFVTTTTPTYEGTAPANSTVRVYVDGVLLPNTVTANGTGNWTLAQPTVLTQGAHTVYATAQTNGAAVSANSNTNTFTVDSVRPSVTISSTATSPTSTSPIPFTVTFLENVTGFVAGDVTVTGGSITGNIVNGTSPGTTYTFTVTPSANGTVTVSIPANVAQDAAGNGNTGSMQFSITYSQSVTAAPSVITPANGSLLNTSTPVYSGSATPGSTVTVYVDGTAIGTTTASGDDFWSLTQPTALTQGSHTVYATAQSPGAAVSGRSNTNTFTVDSVRPTVAISSTATSPTSTSPIPVTVTFSENVTGFVTGDVSVTNGTISGFSGSGTSYSFSVTPVGNGTVTVNVPANVAQDAANNGNTAATQFSIQYNAVVTATVWTGAVSSDWFTAGNWTAGVPTTTIDATINSSAARFPVVASGTADVKNLILGTNASLTQSGGTLTVSGQGFAIDGTFAATGGVVNLNGSIEQRLGGVPTDFWSLTVGPAGARLDGPAAIQRILTLNGNLTTIGNTFTLLSNAATTAMVVNNGGSVAGTATVQRYIDPSLYAGTGYRHYSSPVQSTTVADLATSGFSPVVNPAYNTVGNTVSPFPTVYGFDEGRITGTSAITLDFDYGYFSPASLSTSLTRGRGYTVNIAASEKIDLVGTLNTGAVPAGTLTRGTQTNSGWQLLGNPYPAPLDWKKARTGLPTGVIDAVYVYKPAGQYDGSYQFYQNGFGTLPNGIIGSMQGFFLRVSQPVASFSFLDAWRATSYEDASFNRPAADARPALQLDLVSAQNVHDPAYVYFEEGATAGLDDHYDAAKLPNTTGLNLASVAAGSGLAVNGLPVLQATTIVPLTVGVPVTGSYTLQAASLANFGTTAVYLLDAETGQQIDLKQQSTYRFTASNAALITGRFSLTFGALRPLAAGTGALASSVSLYPNPAQKTAWVELPADLGRKAVTATLLDALGRVVRTQQLPANGNKAHTLSLAELPVGVYSLRLSTEAGLITKRLIIE